ncbi:MAG: hypothetical protein HQ580_01280 [Planctomycetes bacterium]|nr:hypothetical protein [Planctomycetota bacterium]
MKIKLFIFAVCVQLYCAVGFCKEGQASWIAAQQNANANSGNKDRTVATEPGKHTHAVQQGPAAFNKASLNTLSIRLQAVDAQLKLLMPMVNAKDDSSSDSKTESKSETNAEKARALYKQLLDAWQERAKVLQALIQLSKSTGADKQAIAAVIKPSLTDDFSIESGGGWAHDAMAAIGDEGIDLLLKTYPDADEKHRNMVAAAIYGVKDPACLEKLKAIYSETKYKKIKSAALSALAGLYTTDPVGIEALLREAALDQNGTCREVAISNMSRVGPAATKTLLEELVADPTETAEFRARMARRLEDYYPKRRLERVLKELSEPSLDHNRRAAIYGYLGRTEGDRQVLRENIERIKPFLKLTYARDGTPDSRSRVDIWRIIYKATGETLPLELAYDDDEDRDHLIYNIVSDLASPYRGTGVDGTAVARNQILPLITRWKPVPFDDKDLDLLLEASLSANEAQLNMITMCIAKIRDPKWSDRLILAYADSQHAHVQPSIFRAMAEVYHYHNVPAVEALIIKISRDKTKNSHLRRNAMTIFSNNHITFGRGGQGFTIRPELEAYLVSFVQEPNEIDTIKDSAYSKLIRYFPGKYEEMLIEWYTSAKTDDSLRFRLNSILDEFDPTWVQVNQHQLTPLMKVTRSNGNPDNWARATIWKVIYRATKKTLPLELNAKDKHSYDYAKKTMIGLVKWANRRAKLPMTEAAARERVELVIKFWKSEGAKGSGRMYRQ